MLISLLLWIYLFIVTLSYGTAFFSLFRRLVPRQTDSILRAPVVSILGLAAVTWIASVLSLFLPMGLTAHLLVLGGALILLAFFYKDIFQAVRKYFRGKHWLVWLLMLAGAASLLLFAVKPPSNPDTPLYHAQAIHWSEAYPVVPGLGNLDVRLGAGSTWFVLNALFGLAFLGGQSFHLVPSFLFLVSFLYLLDGLQGLLKGELRLSQAVKTALIPFAFYILSDELSSPGTDLPVTLCLWVILCLLLESFEEQESRLSLQAAAFVLSVTAMTYKITGIFIALFAVYLLVVWVRQRQVRLAWLGAGMGAAVALPWLARNFVLSGHWFFPQPLAGFLNPVMDWSIPPERVTLFKLRAQAWAISTGLVWKDIAPLSFAERLALWFSSLTFNQKGIFLLALASPLLFGLFSRLLPQRRSSREAWAVILLAYAGLLLWLFSAPNLRFGYAYLIGLMLLGFAPLLIAVIERAGRLRPTLVLAIGLALVLHQVGMIAQAARGGTPYVKYLVQPAPYARAQADPCTVGDVQLFCARNFRQCGYEAFPCAAQEPDEMLELRGSTFREGFRWRSTNQQ